MTGNDSYMGGFGHDYGLKQYMQHAYVTVESHGMHHHWLRDCMRSEVARFELVPRMYVTYPTYSAAIRVQLVGESS